MPIGEDALAGYSFHIEIGSVSIAQFKEVSGLSAEIQVIEHRENTLKGLPVMKKLPGSRKFGDITLKRGKTNDKALWEWLKKVQDGNIDGARTDGSIVLYDYQHNRVGAFDFRNGWPSKVSIGALSAAGNDILLEECTIVHEGLVPA